MSGGAVALAKRFSVRIVGRAEGTRARFVAHQIVRMCVRSRKAKEGVYNKRVPLRTLLEIQPVILCSLRRLEIFN